MGSLGYGARDWLRKAALGIALCWGTSLAAQEVTIVALGDSLTAGFGLPQTEGFVPQLEAWLEARGHNVAIINAGVSGDTTAGGRARADWVLGPEADALILALGGNDLLRGLPPEQARENLRVILETADARPVPVLLAGLPAPLNYGQSYKAEFDAIFPSLANEFDAILFPDFLIGLRNAAADGIPQTTLLQSDGLHPTALGISHMVEAIGPHVETLIGQIE